MRQNPLQLVALGVCLNGLLLSVVSGENTSAASGSLRWTPHRAAARPLDTRDVMPDEGSVHPDKKSVSTASPANLQIHWRNHQVVNLLLRCRML